MLYIQILTFIKAGIIGKVDMDWKCFAMMSRLSIGVMHGGSSGMQWLEWWQGVMFGWLCIVPRCPYYLFVVRYMLYQLFPASHLSVVHCFFKVVSCLYICLLQGRRNRQLSVFEFDALPLQSYESSVQCWYVGVNVEPVFMMYRYFLLSDDFVG